MIAFRIFEALQMQILSRQIVTPQTAKLRMEMDAGSNAACLPSHDVLTHFTVPEQQLTSSSMLTESAHLVNPAMGDLARAAMLVEHADHPALAAAYEEEYEGMVVIHGLSTIQSEDICRIAVGQLPSGLANLVPWLQIQLAEHNLECASLSFQLAAQVTDGLDKEQLAIDIDRLRRRWQWYKALERTAQDNVEADEKDQAKEKGRAE